MANKYRSKLRRPKRVYEFWLEHPTRSYASIGKTFHVSRERVRQIVKLYKDGQDAKTN
jgi:DNA-directed RNA polymerase sigma subunit (sigma70/sigma32)